MKMKTIFRYVVAALLLTACADTAELNGDASLALGNDTERQPVSFSTYTRRSMTRAGAGGDVSTAALKSTTTDMGKAGFGVFAYYHDDYVYNGQGVPDFMYNQQVKYKDATAGFQYEPLRYWPNENGNSTGSTETDRLSFFAYAPWVDVSAVSGLPADAERQSGITALSANRQTGDPTVTYVVSTDPASGVDLCWAEPCLNLQRDDDRSATSGRVLFQFHHATAKLNVTIDALVDDLAADADPAGGALTADGQTRIYVRSVSFTGFTMAGTLNLNSSIYTDPSKARWQGAREGQTLSKDIVTIYDGRADGQEGVNADLSESPAGLNENVIQSTGWSDANATPGVTRNPSNLFGASTAGVGDPIYVIPTGEPMKVTIVYDIETQDDLSETVSDLSTHGVSIENRITKAITTDGTASGSPITLAAGKLYTVNLHIGLNSVKFDADVSDWETVDDLKLWTQHFNYNGTTGTNGSVQSWTVPETGRYMLEVWGGNGGTGNGRNASYQNSNPGGKGGYASGIFDLTKDQVLYIAVGGKGTNGGMSTSKVNGKGGFNGGADGGVGVATGPSYNWGSAGGGGGATHIALANGQITSFTTDDDLLIVAGGGGGTGRTSGGAGGGETGGLPVYWASNGNPDPWYNTVNTGAGENRKGAAGINGVRAGCCSEGSGGGGGGYRGGNSRHLTATRTQLNNNAEWLNRALGGCGGSSWANSTAQKFRTVAGDNTYTNGHAAISFLGSASDLPSN